ncbi:hypothetical protein O2K51_03080 [Apibacter raozihei]|uniref:DUF6770 family protein n=1 Tax=Apibacter raozihei TaxID=2500547 RepID=UPI000FE3DBE7|nr:DUF6770 family protein [Apibacter raozihei]
MKKVILIVILTLFYNIINAQLLELNKLSKGELIQELYLRDNNKDDLFGYLYIFKIDQLDKKEYLYDYILLDKNLNKVSAGNFTEKLGNFSKKIFVNAIHRNGLISFNINEIATGGATVRNRYRLLNIKDNKLSDAFYLSKDLTKEYNQETKNVRESITFYYEPNSFGYHLYSPLETNQEKKLLKLSSKTIEERLELANVNVNRLNFANENLDFQWSYEFNKSANENQYEKIYLSNNPNLTNTIIGEKYFKGKNNETKLKNGQLFNSFLIFNKDSGQLISEITPYGQHTVNGIEAKEITNINVFIDSEKITFLNRIMSNKVKSFNLDEKKIIGFSKSQYSISTGNEINRIFFTWDQLAEYLTINEFGYIQEKDNPNCYLYLHDVILNSNGNLIFITEQYKTLAGDSIGFAIPGGVKIGDMIIFELDKNMKLTYYKRIEKELQTIRNGVKMQGILADYLNAFDYTGYQNAGNNKYYFFYYNRQIPENGGKKQWFLGIVTYDNGKFTESKIQLKTSRDDSKLNVIPAKNGYVLVTEIFKDKNKSTEIRLEKIN